MAKKKAVKKTTKKKETVEPVATTYYQVNQVDYLAMFEQVNKRIDRIVAAISQSKSVKGM